jgi:hypothetical protein
MLKEKDITGMTLAQIHALGLEQEKRRKRKPDPEAEIPRSKAVASRSAYIYIEDGVEQHVLVSEHDNPPCPPPKRPKWMSKEAWQEHLVRNGLPVTKSFPRLKWPV